MVRLIISSSISLSTVSLSRAALGRGRFRCEPQTNLRTAFRSIRSRSRAERRVRAEERERGGVIYWSFRGIGAFGIKSVRPFTRPSGCYSVSRLCRCPMRLSPSPFPHNPCPPSTDSSPPWQKGSQTYRYGPIRLNLQRGCNNCNVSEMLFAIKCRKILFQKVIFHFNTFKSYLYCLNYFLFYFTILQNTFSTDPGHFYIHIEDKDKRQLKQLQKI